MPDDCEYRATAGQVAGSPLPVPSRHPWRSLFHPRSPCVFGNAGERTEMTLALSGIGTVFFRDLVPPLGETGAIGTRQYLSGGFTRKVWNQVWVVGV